MKFKCDRCDSEFEKPESGRVAKIIDMSVHARFGDGRVNHVYYLCPKCASNFRHYMNYEHKKKGV